MPVVVRLDEVLAAKRVTAKELGRRIGLSETQLSLLRTGKVRGMRFSTLAALCAVLECTPGDLLSYELDPADADRAHGGPGD
ncbi:helix-turn-helix domain-containing protein [Cognatilysobacter bugurensis]|uniref:Transcriptional regulator n=1 Tax=Cognatilysobacter bugurensis TaxID=543356 RepID=A0A918T206_9GAMM|nr:helix-turn-helix transcriptional regulator [Lysobacter bugurensis]GHA86155.1 transcriptional regulator [Lysobacter bugurensis]